MLSETVEISNNLFLHTPMLISCLLPFSPNCETRQKEEKGEFLFYLMLLTDSFWLPFFDAVPPPLHLRLFFPVVRWWYSSNQTPRWEHPLGLEVGCGTGRKVENDEKERDKIVWKKWGKKIEVGSEREGKKDRIIKEERERKFHAAHAEKELIRL